MGHFYFAERRTIQHGYNNRKEWLTLRRRRSRKRALGTRRSILVPARANQRWSLDARPLSSDQWRTKVAMSDVFADSQRFRVLCILGNCTRGALATVVDRSLSGARMTRELDDLIRRRGQSDMIVSDLPLVAPLVRATMATARK